MTTLLAPAAPARLADLAQRAALANLSVTLPDRQAEPAYTCGLLHSLAWRGRRNLYAHTHRTAWGLLLPMRAFRHWKAADATLAAEFRTLAGGRFTWTATVQPILPGTYWPPADVVWEQVRQSYRGQVGVVVRRAAESSVRHGCLIGRTVQSLRRLCAWAEVMDVTGEEGLRAQLRRLRGCLEARQLEAACWVLHGMAL